MKKIAVVGVGGRTGTMLAFELSGSADVLGVGRKEEVERVKEGEFYLEREREKTIRFIKKIVKGHAPTRVKHYLLYIFAGLFIISPLPDEVGISMLAGLTTIKIRVLGIISFLLHTIGIFLLLAWSA